MIPSLTSAVALLASLGASGIRLPTDVVPHHYDLRLTIIPQSGRFSGEDTNDLEVLKPTKAVTLHSVDLNVQRASLIQAGGTADPDPARRRLDADGHLRAAPGAQAGAGVAEADLRGAAAP